MDKAKRDQIRFFADNAGYSVPPGRMACAKELATAEDYKQEQVESGAWLVTWVEDDAVDTSWMDPHQKRAFEGGSLEVLQCSITDPATGDYLASLCGVSIYTNDRDYLRVVEAELSREAMPALVRDGGALPLEYLGIVA